MTQEEIKACKDELFKTIEDSKEELESLRKICDHPEEEEVTWSWRIGCYDQAYICEDCGEFLRYKNKMLDYIVTTS